MQQLPVPFLLVVLVHEDTGELEAHGDVSISPLLHGEIKQRP
jgi:hypothetical protein